MRDALARVSAAIESGAWNEALSLLDAAGDDASTPEGWELRAQAAYGNGDFEDAVAAWEALHELFEREGEPSEAARAAAMIAMYLMMDTGLMAPVRGWLRRAERLVDGRGEAPAHAVIAMTRTYERFMCGDMEAAREHSRRAIEIGERTGVQPAVVIGRVAAARVTIFDGDLQDGLDQLDEVATLLMSGGADVLTTGMMYCELICAMQGLAMYERAAEWTDVMERWRHGAAFGGINGRCRVHRAEMLRISGPCDEAEAEALGACEELRPWMRREFGWPLAELGTIRLRKGDLDGAEESLLAAHANAWTPHPGLALLRLEQGDVEAATALIGDAVTHPFDVPSKERPPAGPLRMAPLYDAQAEIAAAAGDAATARSAADELARVADAYPSTALVAAAALADARALLAAGDAAGAVDRAEFAVARWADVGAPFETAAARVVLGTARLETGNVAGALVDVQAAGKGFEQFGARLRAERTAALIDEVQRAGTVERLDGPAAPGVSAAGRRVDRGVFRCDGDTRTIGFRGTTVLVRDLKGLRYLERLLAEPGREFHALDLVAVERGSLPTGGHSTVAEVSSEGDTGPVIDAAARAAYRRRLADVDEDIEEATRLHDLGRLELAQRDRDFLIAELTSAVGLGGRERTTGSTSERARTAVTRSIRYAVGKVADHHAAMARHLDQAVQTGTYCAYRPDDRAPISWET